MTRVVFMYNYNFPFLFCEGQRVLCETRRCKFDQRQIQFIKILSCHFYVLKILIKYECKVYTFNEELVCLFVCFYVIPI